LDALSRWNDADAFDLNAIDGGALFPATTALCGNVGDLIEDVIAFHQFAERGVLTVKEFGVAVTQEKLTAR
jgi:hypothetical protein